MMNDRGVGALHSHEAIKPILASLLREGNPDDMDNIAPAMLRNSMMVFRLGPSKQKQNDAKQVSKSIKGIF
jgi:hypothetical protein